MFFLSKIRPRQPIFFQVEAKTASMITVGKVGKVGRVGKVTKVANISKVA